MMRVLLVLAAALVVSAQQQQQQSQGASAAAPSSGARVVDLGTVPGCGASSELKAGLEQCFVTATLSASEGEM